MLVLVYLCISVLFTSLVIYIDHLSVAVVLGLFIVGGTVVAISFCGPRAHLRLPLTVHRCQSSSVCMSC